MARRTLFIKLLRNGRTVTRSMVKGRYVYTGRDWKCHLVDPASPARRQKLLVRTFAGYRINLPIDSKGTFIYKGSTLTLDDMVAWGLAVKSRKGYLVKHRRGMSADIHIGDATFILEYGQPPTPELDPEMALEPAKHGHLPLRYRLQVPNRTDLTFLTLLTLILLVHIAGVRGLRDYPIPEITAIRELPRRISRLILEPVAPPPSKVAPKGETRGEGTTAGVEKEPEKVKSEAEAPHKGDTPAPTTREAIRSQVSKMGVLGVLTGRGTAGRKTAGAGISVLQLDAELQRDLESMLADISGITTSSSVEANGGGAVFGGTEPDSDLIGIEGQLQDAIGSEPIQVSSLGAAGAKPFGALDGSDAGKTSGSQTEEYVAPEQREERSTRTISRVVAAHTGAIRYAYNRELRKKPSLRGKIVLTFTISPEGDVTECRIEESAMNWPPLENSLVKMVRTWRFPKIPEGDVTVSYPLVFFPSM